MLFRKTSGICGGGKSFWQELPKRHDAHDLHVHLQETGNNHVWRNLRIDHIRKDLFFIPYLKAFLNF
ncbi:hypothetical protein CS542_01110 [Pedobacter sp. IW39]|nr:hypothetical protein CS542_01110 [Pedobacter sp. IW39]